MFLQYAKKGYIIKIYHKMFLFGKWCDIVKIVIYYLGGDPMKKLASSVFLASILTLSSFACLPNPSSAATQSNEPNELEVDQLNEVSPMAIPTGLRLIHPPEITGASATARIELRFSGDTAGGQYRWTLDYGDGTRPRTGSTNTTSFVTNRTYTLSPGHMNARYNLRATVQGYTSQTDRGTIQHCRTIRCS